LQFNLNNLEVIDQKMKIFLFSLWLATEPISCNGDSYQHNPFSDLLEDTCVKPMEKCSLVQECCEGNHSFCVNSVCVGCRDNYDCLGTVKCVEVETSRAHCDMSSLKPVEGIDLILQGYDIFLSDPLRSKSINDEGIQATNIFKHSYKNPTYSKERRVPDRYTVLNEYPRCLSTFSSSSIKSSSEITTEISKSVSVGGEASVPVHGVMLNVGAGVGAGSYSKTVHKATENEMTVSSKAECQIRVLRMTDHRSYPDLSPDLTSWLDNVFNGENYDELFKMFGTHVPRVLTIGALFGATTTVTESQKEELSTSSKTVETTLNAGIPFIFNAKSDTATDEQRAAHTALMTAGVKSTTWSIGGDTVSTNEAFYDGAQTNPAHLVFKDLESLCKILQTKTIEKFKREECFAAYIPHCKGVMKGTAYNCDVMIGKQNEEFDCVFDSHCEENESCHEGHCVGMQDYVEYGDYVYLQVMNVNSRWLSGARNSGNEGVITRNLLGNDHELGPSEKTYQWLIQSMPDGNDVKSGTCLKYGDKIFLKNEFITNRWLTGGRTGGNEVVETRNLLVNDYERYGLSYQWIVRKLRGDGGREDALG